MPYKSEKQRRFMHAKHPDIAARWDKKYGGHVNPNLAMGEVHYRTADDADKVCASCGYFDAAQNGCRKWKAQVGANMTCDSWEA